MKCGRMVVGELVRGGRPDTLQGGQRPPQCSGHSRCLLDHRMVTANTVAALHAQSRRNALEMASASPCVS